MIIYLIRHGDNDSLGKYLPGRLPDIHLNETGKKQAEAIRKSLATSGIQTIYASPLERAIETAQPLADALHLNIHFEPDLIEMDAGALTGKPFPELKRSREWKLIRKDPVTNGYPGGEDFPSAQFRLWNIITRIHESHSEDSILAVFSHADCIKMVIVYALQMPLPYFPRLAVDTASLSILGFKKETIWLGGLNLHPPYNLPAFNIKDQQTS
jgi:broad specificity phosphatase PhoE